MGLGGVGEGSTKQSMFEDTIAFYVDFKEQEKAVSIWHPCVS